MAIIQKDIIDVEKENMLQYFLSIMYDRAIADVRDGQKPVQRAIIYDMFENGFTPNKPHVKCAKVVGSVIASKHPRGDASVYDALTRMSQPFSVNIPLIDFHGNNGSIDGSSAAAYRYSESRLSNFIMLNLTDIKNNAVDFTPNFDNTSELPLSLPVQIPLLLLNGSIGIAGGFAQSVPTHNLGELVDITIKLIKNPNTSLQDVAKALVPDFPTGGIICSKKAVENAYMTGRGAVKIRAKTNIIQNKNGTSEIDVVEIPYMTTIGPRMGTSTNINGGLLNSIVNKIKDGTIEGIKDIQDQSNKNGVCIKIFIKKDYDPEIILNQLYKYTQMETTFKILLVCKNGDYFKTYNIKEMLTEFIEYRYNTIHRIIFHNIEKANYDLHINKGLEIALSDIDGVIKIIKSSKDRQTASTKLKSKFGLTDLQTNAILDMKLVSLTNLEISKIRKTIQELEDKLVELKASLSKDKIEARMISEMKDISNKYGFPRKTTVEEIDTELTTEDIIPEEDSLVMLTKDHYIKRVTNEINTQRRNTQGNSIGSNSITDIFSASNKDHLLCFTNTGRIYDLKVYEIDNATSVKSKGRKVESYIDLKPEEKINNILCITNDQMNDSESQLVFITKNGLIKRTKMEYFNNIRTTGLIATLLKTGDELVTVKYIDTSKKMQDLIFSTKNGSTVRYEYTEFPELKRDTYGCMGICLEDGDYVTDMTVIENEDQLIFFSTKNGFGKTVKVYDPVERVRDLKNPDSGEKEKYTVIDNDGFPRLSRSSNIKGRIGIKLKKDDELVSILTINSSDDDLILVTEKKMLAIESTELKKPIKRPTYGVHLVDLQEGDNLVKVILK